MVRHHPNDLYILSRMMGDFGEVHQSTIPQVFVQKIAALSLQDGPLPVKTWSYGPPTNGRKIHG